MSSSEYPYATFEQDGYQLAVVEQGDAARSLAAPLVADELRFAVQPGDLVKVIIEYRDSSVAKGSGAEFDAEHMWVKLIGCDDGCIRGELDSSPQYTKLLKSGDVLALHPTHIIAIWKN